MVSANRRLLGARDLGADPIAIGAISPRPVVLTGLAMLAFEATKQVLFAHISLWESHALTIAVTTTLTVVVAWQSVDDRLG